MDEQGYMPMVVTEEGQLVIGRLEAPLPKVLKLALDGIRGHKGKVRCIVLKDPVTKQSYSLIVQKEATQYANSHMRNDVQAGLLYLVTRRRAA